MGNLLILISLCVILFILFSGTEHLISKIWKKLIYRCQFSTDQNLHRELTELEQEAFQAYNALIRESLKVAEKDYHKQREKLNKVDKLDRTDA